MTDDEKPPLCPICQEDDAYALCDMCERYVCWSCVEVTIRGNLYRGEEDLYECVECFMEGQTR